MKREHLENFINAALDLTESVKRNIQKDGMIDDTTVLRLNDLIIAFNEIADLQKNLEAANMDSKTKNTKTH